MMRTAVVVMAMLAPASSARAEDPLVAAGRKRDAAFVAAGFLAERGFDLGSRALTMELEIPPYDDGDNPIALWLATPRGQIAVKLTGPDGKILFEQHTAALDQTLVANAAPGLYTLALTPLDGASLHGVLAVKGVFVPGPHDPACAIEAGRVTEHAADPARGFAWPYLLVAGKDPHAIAHDRLLVLPNNTGFRGEALDMIRAAGQCDVHYWAAFADRLGASILVPLFPRPNAPPPADNLYLHALSRAAIATPRRDVARVDRQLIAMIDDARRTAGIPLQPRVLMIGHSAAGMFTNRFAVLHPDRVLAAAVSSPGGWPLAPVATAHGDALPYPVGIADVAKLTGAPVDLAAVRKVKLVFLLGGLDDNDSVPARDSYDPAAEAVIMRDFGKTPVARWDAARALYAGAKLDATFTLYPGVGHEISKAGEADIEAAFRAAISAAP